MSKTTKRDDRWDTLRGDLNARVENAPVIKNGCDTHNAHFVH